MCKLAPQPRDEPKARTNRPASTPRGDDRAQAPKAAAGAALELGPAAGRCESRQTFTALVHDPLVAMGGVNSEQPDTVRKQSAKGCGRS